MSHQETEELSEDEIFVQPANAMDDLESQKQPQDTILPESKSPTDEPAGDSGGTDGPHDASENGPQDPEGDRPAGEPPTPRNPRAPYGLTKSGRPRKKPLKQLSDEERAATAEKRRAALEKGRNARAAKILERKRAVMAFFGEDCLQSNTLKNLEAAMETAKRQLKSTEKKVWAKPSKTTVKTERVVGRTREHEKPTEQQQPSEERPEPAPTPAFRPVSATPEPIVWRPKPKKKPLW